MSTLYYSFLQHNRENCILCPSPEELFFDHECSSYGITTDLNVIAQKSRQCTTTISSSSRLSLVYSSLLKAASKIRPDLEPIIRLHTAEILLENSESSQILPPKPLQQSQPKLSGLKRERSSSSFQIKDEEEKQHSVVSKSISQMPSSPFEIPFAELFFDGAARGNPGVASGAAYLRINDKTNLVYCYAHVPFATNNEAEYLGLVLGLQVAVFLGIKHLKVFGDSLLVVNHCKGSWKCTMPHLQSLLKVVHDFSSKIATFSIDHIPRVQNAEADRLSNCGMNGGRETIVSVYDYRDKRLDDKISSFLPILPPLLSCRQRAMVKGQTLLPFYERIQ
jgi:ribonuclease HI